MTSRKPWPSDAIMVVASIDGEEDRSAMESVVLQVCRDCDRLVAACSSTIKKAALMPCRHGRPVLFFCTDCACLYDAATIQVFVDDRRPETANPEAT